MGKSEGMKKLQKEIKTQEDLDLFKKSIENYKKEMARLKTDLKYTKHFSTFVNCWRDFTTTLTPVVAIGPSKAQKEYYADLDKADKQSSGQALDNPSINALLGKLKGMP